MQLIEVRDKTTAGDFIRVNVELNKGFPGYIRPLDAEINEVFDPGKNKAFRQGKCIRWILKDDEGRLCGRIAAFTNKKYRNKGDEFPVGGIGFFDCIRNQDAADMLFDVAKHWLMQQGMEAMDGPINFGERDKWWGLVIEGFHEPPYGMNFNQPYYRDLFEQYGFQTYFKQICFGLDPKKPLSEKLQKRHAQVEMDPAFSATHINKSRLQTFAADFTTVYNKAWAGHGGLKELKKDQVVLMFNRMKPLMDERTIWFVYHHKDPIAIFVNLPDLNQYFKHFNGRFGLLQKIHFLWLKYTKSCKKLTGLVFGIVPEFAGKGIDAYMIAEAAKIVQHATHYTDYEMQWVGDFNPKMINIAKSLGDSYVSRTLVTYRYQFDRTREFKRHPILH
jgi:hypothetical protein